MLYRPQPLPQLIGTSAAIHALRRQIQEAAATDAKALITGESGSGKEVVAQLIHASSKRQGKPMVAINCAAMTESLLETELFGHARGSFTGAYRDRPGILETANGGTVLLDEIGETSPRMQGVLLRFLETGEVQRVGSDTPHRRVDVRILCATHRTLSEEMAAQRFREDLYYRLNILQLHVPALREHTEDIPALVDYWLKRFEVAPPAFAPDAMEALTRYGWPGNVRELRNVLERVVSRGRSLVTAADLPAEVVATSHEQLALTTTGAPSRVDIICNRLSAGESFWSVVYEPFIQRDLTREELRTIVRRGLAQTGGNYRVLVDLFHMPAGDYKRFLTFLRKHQCHVPFQAFRCVASLHAHHGQPTPHQAAERT